jgi:hypothetical protein
MILLIDILINNGKVNHACLDAIELKLDVILNKINAELIL